MFLFFVLYDLMLPQKFYGSEMRHGIFGGLNFGAGIFWVLSFAPIQSSQSLEIRSTPPPGGGPRGFRKCYISYIAKVIPLLEIQHCGVDPGF